jgi:Coiled-coil domain-containing protein 55 (DUF2040)
MNHRGHERQYGLISKKPGATATGSDESSLSSAFLAFTYHHRMVLFFNILASIQRPALRSIFGDESDGSDDKGDHQNNTGADVKRVNRILSQKASGANNDMQKLHNEALATDPSIFDYDEIYDSLRATEAASCHRLSQQSHEPV